ncbi:MAG: aldo/keto reductase, partial [Bacteroidota bacterium]
DQCLRLGIRPSAWSPFGGGRIFTDGDSPELQRVRKAIEQLGESHGATVDQILLAFLLQHPAGILPILGSSKIERIQSARAALEVQLSHEDWYQLWEAATGVEVP